MLHVCVKLINLCFHLYVFVLAELEKSQQVAMSLEERMREAERERREMEEARQRAEDARREAEEAAHLEKAEREVKVCNQSEANLLSCDLILLQICIAPFEHIIEMNFKWLRDTAVTQGSFWQYLPWSMSFELSFTCIKHVLRKCFESLYHS